VLVGLLRGRGPSLGFVSDAVSDVLRFHHNGAGDGNRTRVPSLGSSCSASELHPRGDPLCPIGSAKKAPQWRIPARIRFAGRLSLRWRVHSAETQFRWVPTAASQNEQYLLVTLVIVASSSSAMLLRPCATQSNDVATIQGDLTRGTN
jgi:hypothetical protein